MYDTKTSRPSFPLVSVGKIPGKYQPIPNQNIKSRCNSSTIELEFYRFGIFGRYSAGWYFLVFTEPIPEENLVGTFWYFFFGGNPFFP
jgi:hypothetical protein